MRPGFAELSNYAFLTRSTCKTLKDVDDVEMFERRIHAMQTIGIKKEDLTEVWTCTCIMNPSCTCCQGMSLYELLSLVYLQISPYTLTIT